MTAHKSPLESDEQATVVQWLRANGILFTATANGAHLSGSGFKQGAKLKRTGVESGVPDLLIFSKPSFNGPVVSGVAIEMKRRNAPPSATSAEQEWWLGKLTEHGWVAFVARGADEAIGRLMAMGYGNAKA